MTQTKVLRWWHIETSVKFFLSTGQKKKSAGQPARGGSRGAGRNCGSEKGGREGGGEGQALAGGGGGYYELIGPHRKESMCDRFSTAGIHPVH